MANDLIYATAPGQAAGVMDQARAGNLHLVPTDRTAAVGSPVGDLRQFRISKRESQEKFWGRFGVTQSSGSRFETGLAIPAPVAILLKLYVNGRLTDGDLQE